MNPRLVADTAAPPAIDRMPTLVGSIASVPAAGHDIARSGADAHNPIGSSPLLEQGAVVILVAFGILVLALLMANAVWHGRSRRVHRRRQVDGNPRFADAALPGPVALDDRLVALLRGPRPLRPADHEGTGRPRSGAPVWVRRLGAFEREESWSPPDGDVDDEADETDEDDGPGAVTFAP